MLEILADGQQIVRLREGQEAQPLLASQGAAASAEQQPQQKRPAGDDVGLVGRLRQLGEQQQQQPDANAGWLPSMWQAFMPAPTVQPQPQAASAAEQQARRKPTPA